MGKSKLTAILLGFLFIPLGFLYTYKRNQSHFWLSLVLFGAPIVLFIFFFYNILLLFFYIICHFISLYRFFISQSDSFYLNYPREDFNLQDLK